MLVRPYLWCVSTDLSVTSISMVLFAEFAAASLLITIGGPLGRKQTPCEDKDEFLSTDEEALIN
jgi:hypothetical protein